jgi:multiple sugar transport system permease protein
MISSSFKPNMDIMTPPTTLFPHPATTANYGAVFSSPFFRWTANSVIVAVVRVTGTVVTSTLAGYAFARLRWRGRNVVFVLYLAVMGIPYQLLLIPRFIEFREIGLANTLWTLILPGAFSAFGAFLMRQFFMSIPQDFIDAARVDGASQLVALRRVIVPLAAPAIAALAMVDFIWSWNDYETPLVMISSVGRYTIPLGLTTINSVEGGGLTPGPILAGSVLSLIPVAAIFLGLQRQFQRAVLGSGVKG